MTSLFIAILNMSITASYIAIAVIVTRLLLKKVPKVFSYVLWLAVLIRLVFPFSFNSAFSFLGYLNSNAQTGGQKYVPINIGLMKKPVVDVGINIVNSAVNSSLPSATTIASVNPMQIILEITMIIWTFGIVLLFIYSVISYLKVKSNVKTATLIKDNIFETDKIITPFLCGFINPKIFVPIGLSENELSYIIGHELAHIKRLDYIIKPFAFLVLIMHWFNPLMWVSFTLMSKDMEMSCDESVIKSMGSDVKGGYSNSLLSLSVKRSGLLFGSPLAFGESNIKSRIKNVLNYKRPSLWVVIISIISIVSLIIVFTANPKQIQTNAGTYLRYKVKTLMDNKTPYVGDNSKVSGLIGAIPVDKGIDRNGIELQTTASPYGITIHFNMNDDSVIMVKGSMGGDEF